MAKMFDDFDWKTSDRDEPCCIDTKTWGLRGMGSHYHCYRCRESSSMMGHYMSIHRGDVTRTTVAGHMCCPGDCELKGKNG